MIPHVVLCLAYQRERMAYQNSSSNPGAGREGGLWGCNPAKEKQRKVAAQCKRAHILHASAAAWYRRASFYVVVL